MNYYVDFVDGADTNNGTSTETSFKHCPGDPSATNNADINLGDGDIVYFKKGTTYEGRILSTHDNTTYSITDWGVGDFIHDGSGYEDCIQIAHDDVIITGVDLNRNYKFTGTVSQNGIQATGTNTDGITITYCNFTAFPSGANRTGVKLGGSTYAHTGFEIAYNTFSDIEGYAIKISGQGGSGNGSIHDNTITDCGANENAQVNISDTEGVGITGISFYDNIIYTGKAADVNGVNFQDAAGDVYGNEIYGCYRGISYSPAATPSLVGTLNIYCNSIHDNGYYGILVENTDSDAHAIIYNNVIWDNTNTEIKLGSGATYCEVYENTVYNSGGAYGIYVGSSATHVTIKNNIVFCVGDGSHVSMRTDTLTGFTSDYNVIYRTHDTDAFYYSTWRTLAEWRSDTSQDAHSFFADPLFKAIDSDFSVENGSPAIDKGYLLGNPYNIDILGTSRPQGTLWDIGAYEFEVAPPETGGEGPFAYDLVMILS